MMDDELDKDFFDNDSESENKSPSDSYSGQGGFYQVDKKKFAWGLVWDVPVQDSDDKVSTRSLKKQARENAKVYNADLFVISDKQFGLASTKFEHKAGMRTVAMSLIDRWGENFIAAFNIDGFYYLLVVKNGVVLPGVNDIRVDSKEFAINFIEEKISGNYDEWGVIVAPEDFDIHQSKEFELSTILRSSRSKRKLVDATSKSLVKNAIIFAGTAIVLYGGYYAYNAYQEHKIKIENEQRALRLKAIALRNNQLASQNAMNETWPYDNKNIGQYALMSCEQAMLITPVILPGYEFESMSCNPNSGSVTVNFNQTYGSFVTVVDLVNELTNMKPKITHQNKKIIITYNYKPAFTKVFTKHNVFGNVEDEYSWLNRKFSLLGLSPYTKMSLTIPPKSPPDNNGDKGPIDSKLVELGVTKEKQKIDKIVFKDLSITITSVFSPSEWIEYLAPLKAFTVDSVTYTAAKGNSATSANIWKFSGHAYEGIWQSNVDNPGSAKKEIRSVDVGSKESVSQHNLGNSINKNIHNNVNNKNINNIPKLNLK